MGERLVDHGAFAAGAWADCFLDGVPDDVRDKAAMALIGAISARLTLMVGARACAASLYALADLAATKHLADLGPGHG